MRNRSLNSDFQPMFAHFPSTGFHRHESKALRRRFAG
jgi:hypothetical protein